MMTASLMSRLFDANVLSLFDFNGLLRVLSSNRSRGHIKRGTDNWDKDELVVVCRTFIARGSVLLSKRHSSAWHR